jgi:hypothetical protein
MQCNRPVEPSCVLTMNHLTISMYVQYGSAHILRGSAALMAMEGRKEYCVKK